jgi:hypothetical protein
MSKTCRIGGASVVMLLISGWNLAIAEKPAPNGGGGPGFSGQATVVRATVLGVTTVLSDTGPLPSQGGALEASLLTASIPGVLTVDVLHATTVGQGDRSRSEASVADLSLTLAGNTITAGFLMSRAMAVCAKRDPATSGSSEIAALVINGQAIVVSGSPNQTIALPAGLGEVIINEQSTGPGTITVNALHVIVNGVADVVISSAHADVTSCNRAPTCGNQDFVTGGGWITGTPSGAKGTFAVGGGIKNGSFWGHLTYIDHGNGGPHVKGTGVTQYDIVSTTTRHIRGTAEINGQGGFTYDVIVSDNGEPGRNDMFQIQLSNGYYAAGNLAGGNIQIHHPCE